MSLFKKKIGGEIGYYGLTDWWLNSLTDQERKAILKTYQPLGLGENSLTEGNIIESSQSRLSFLSTLATWFKKPETYQIAKKIMEKAEKYVSETKHIIDVYFHYQNKIEIYYRNRETESDGLERAIQACEQQISISDKAIKVFKKEFDECLPMHKGYQQLAIIREKQREYKSVIKICERALQQRWGGDWERRIEKAKKKLGVNEG